MINKQVYFNHNNNIVYYHSIENKGMWVYVCTVSVMFVCFCQPLYALKHDICIMCLSI